MREHINNSDISKDRYVLNKNDDLKKDIELHCELFVRKYLTVKNNVDLFTKFLV